jgi:hypothetical protein
MLAFAKDYHSFRALHKQHPSAKVNRRAYFQYMKNTSPLGDLSNTKHGVFSTEKAASGSNSKKKWQAARAVQHCQTSTKLEQGLMTDHKTLARVLKKDSPGRD